MPNFEPGAEIGVRCEVKPGPFSGERLVSIDTVSGAITGFVSEDELKQTGEDGWLVRAVVKAAKADIVEVWIRGSFFTTNGLATITRQMATAA